MPKKLPPGNIATCTAIGKRKLVLDLRLNIITELKYKGGNFMASWKCSNCGYTFEADAHPNECPSCKKKCEFLDATCYTPDCTVEGMDTRIGKKK
jgi:rubredoxin